MRVLIDALGAPAGSGGMQLHALETIRAWSVAFPEDELLVIGDRWISAEFATTANVRTLAWGAAGVLRRAVGQLLATPTIARWFDADVVVALSPVVSPFVGRPSAAFVHDWRHLRAPEEFGGLQSRYRELWRRTAARVDVVACISRKTLDETATIADRTDGLLLVENGRDHVARWELPSGPAESGTVVTFGHHNNKRPDVVVRAFAELSEPLRAGKRLTVLGTRGAMTAELQTLARSLGIGDLVHVLGFVSDADYQSAIATASAVVLASSDEGFGLPVGEAQYFGIPVVVASDNGLSSIHTGLFEGSPDASGLADAISAALRRGRQLGLPLDGRRWADAVRTLRSSLSASALPDVVSMNA